jgi:hypothetical protein
VSITASFLAELTPRWQAIAPLRLGGTEPRHVTPNRHVIVEGEGLTLRCEIFQNGLECFPFEDVQVWRGLLLVGYGCHLYVVNLATRAVTEHRYGSYFGSLYIDPDYCLVASGASLYRLDEKGGYAWASRDLGIDGVLVHDVSDGVVHGDGEWDPPGGWRPFSVRLSDGARVTPANV